MKEKIYPETLAHWLDKSGKKPVDLARHLQIGKSAVSQWLRGTRPIPVERRGQIAEFLGCTVKDLLHAEEDAQIRALIHDRVLRQKGAELARTLAYLQERDKTEEDNPPGKTLPPLKMVANGD